MEGSVYTYTPLEIDVGGVRFRDVYAWSPFFDSAWAWWDTPGMPAVATSLAAHCYEVAVTGALVGYARAPVIGIPIIASPTFTVGGGVSRCEQPFTIDWAFQVYSAPMFVGGGIPTGHGALHVSGTAVGQFDVATYVVAGWPDYHVAHNFRIEYTIDAGTLTINSPEPEPATMLLSGAALLLLAATRRRFK